MLNVHVLGQLRVDLDGHALPPPASGRARSLLAWLALHPGVHPRSRVASVFWPEVREASARASLRTTLALLRSSLGGTASACIVATRENVGLDGPGLWVDVRMFEELAAAGRLEDAVALGRGELLPGLDDEWALDARDAHRERLARLVARLAEDCELAGDLEGALARTRERVELEPLSEEACRSLIRRLDAAGDRAQALASYRRLCERLRRDLGVPPSAATRELAARVERGAPVAGTLARPRAKETAAALPAPLARREPVALVGRTAEVDGLLAAWRAARSGGLRFVLLSGEAGTGKTRLASELARRVHAGGAAVLLGRCHEEQLVPYEPFAEIVVQLAADEAGLDLISATPGAAELVRLEPALASRLPALAPPVSGDPEGARYRLHEAVAGLVGSAAAERPVLLLLEDLHWAARPSLLLLAHIVRSAHAAEVLVAGTFREGEGVIPEPLDTLLGQLHRGRTLDRMTLEGLDAGGVATLASLWLGAEAPTGLAEAVRRRTGGNPLFVEELVRHVRESAATAGAGAGWPEALRAAGIPQGIEDVISRRVSRLSEPAQRVLSLAAVLGDEPSFAELELVAELPDEALVEVLDELAGARLLREDGAVPGRYAFAHALVRETVLARLSTMRRALLHGRIATALETLHRDCLDEHLAELAHHTAAALPHGDPERAACYARRAAEQALERHAYEEAAGHAGRALAALASTGGAIPQHGELLLALGEAQLRAGTRDAARDTFLQAAAEARRSGAPERLARAALGHSGLGVTLLSVRDDSVALLEETLAALPERDSQLRARVLARLAVELYFAPSPDRREQLSEEAVDSARRTGGRAALLEALNARRVALWSPDHLSERLDLSEELVGLAREAGDRERELQGLNWLVVDLLEATDLPGTLAAIDAHELLAEELRLPSYRWYVPAWRGTVALLQGRPAEAERLAAEADSVGRETQDENLEIFVQAQRVAIRFELGELSRGDIDRVVARSAASASPAVWSTWLALLQLESGRPDLARRELERFPAGTLASLPRDTNLVGCLTSLAWAATLIGDTPRCASAYELLLPYAGRCVVQGRAIGCLGGVSFYLGLLATRLGLLERAEEHLGDALELHERLDARSWVVRTKLARARMLAARGAPGDGARARELRAEAAGLAGELGLPNLLTRTTA